VTYRGRSRSRAHVDPDGGHFFYSRRLTEVIRSLLPEPRALEPIAGNMLPRAA
jgi:hypothetical protein